MFGEMLLPKVWSCLFVVHHALGRRVPFGAWGFLLMWHSCEERIGDFASSRDRLSEVVGTWWRGSEWTRVEWREV